MAEQKSMQEMVESLPSRKVWIAQPKETVNTESKPWEVRKENGEKAVKDFSTQEEAWERAMEIARNEGTNPDPAGARKKGTDGEFKENRFYPHPSMKDSRHAENSEEESTDESQKLYQVSFLVAKPVKASEYYDPRFEQGLGDGFKSPGYNSLDVYIDGREKNGEIVHNRDVKAQQATGSDVMFIYETDGELSHEQLEDLVSQIQLSNIGRRINYYHNGKGKKPYVPALLTTPEMNPRVKAVRNVLDNAGIEYDAMSRQVLAYVPEQML